eukprot:403354185
MIERSFNDPDLWNNDHPIILVHGYCGSTMDENWILGGYFHYAFSKTARYLGIDEQTLQPIYMNNIYEADVSPIGSAFDRACELYQQIIGEERIRQIAQEQDISLAEAVYGKTHVKDHHRNKFYKIKYLKTQEAESKRMYAFPNGLPGWNNEKIKKIHFVGHSMGAITVRYFQYLLEIGYFDEIAGKPKSDKSKIVASLTCLSGANNGSLIVNNCGLQYDRELSDWILKKNGRMILAFKMNVFFQNIYQSQNYQLERIYRKILENDGTHKYELSYQYQNPILYDMNVEMWDWNRKDNESRYNHLTRLYNEQFQVESKDLSFVDLNPQGLIRLNQFLKTNQNTYYFGITNGFQDKNRTENREVFTLPQHISRKSIGFDLDVDQDINFKNTELKKYNRRKRTFFEKLQYKVALFMKYLMNPTFSHFSFFYETQTQVDALQSHLSNLKNEKMNNVEAIDYVNKDWTEDNDVCISRKSTEFPRLNFNYSNLSHEDKPWGNQGDPQLIDFYDHPIFTKDCLKPGIWYYGGIPKSDHLDLCGFPPKLSPIRTLLNTEYRMEIWRNIFIRVKMLKFDEL